MCIRDSYKVMQYTGSAVSALSMMERLVPRGEAMRPGHGLDDPAIGPLVSAGEEENGAGFVHGARHRNNPQVRAGGELEERCELQADRGRTRGPGPEAGGRPVPPLEAADPGLGEVHLCSESLLGPSELPAPLLADAAPPLLPGRGLDRLHQRRLDPAARGAAGAPRRQRRPQALPAQRRLGAGLDAGRPFLQGHCGQVTRDILLNDIFGGSVGNQFSLVQ